MAQSTLAANPPGAASEEKHDPKTCPFCPEDKPKPEANKLDNNSTKLGTACHAADTLGLPEPGPQQWCIIYVQPKTGADDLSGVTTQPHHCIPGKESLKGDVEHDILEFIEEAKGTIEADIGYDVNHKNNGVWLVNKPEHFQGGRKIKPASGMKWGSLTTNYPDEQFSMAVACMQEGNRQFHDRHPDYSDEVTQRLETLRLKIAKGKTDCPIESGKATKLRPPVGLIAKMDNLSKHLASKLVGHPSGWQKPLFTSRFAEKVIEEFGT